jgi:hypothetical protein
VSVLNTEWWEPCFKGISPLIGFPKFNVIEGLAIDYMRETEFSHADSLIKEFVTETEVLYGKINMVYNFHLLSHLANSVRHCGPLWSTSNFHLGMKVSRYERNFSEVRKRHHPRFKTGFI